jgi:hypothetical protein
VRVIRRTASGRRGRLAQRAVDLEDALEVRVHLQEGEELRGEHVVERGDEHRHRHDLEPLNS